MAFGSSTALTLSRDLLQSTADSQDVHAVLGEGVQPRQSEIDGEVTANWEPADYDTPVVLQPRDPKINDQTRFEVVQAFEGEVLKVDTGVLQARLFDRTVQTRDPEVVDIALDEISDDDRSLVKPGAVFYMSIGYRVRRWGQKESTSVIVFRRLPAWTRGELKRGRELAAEWKYMFTANGLQRD